MVEKSFGTYMNELDQVLKAYIPPRDKWTPIERSLYGVIDPYSLSRNEAEEIRLRALQYSFNYHYAKNDFYKKFCQEKGIQPGDIKSFSDLKQIPLILDRFFKDYPMDQDFALWIRKILTVKISADIFKKIRSSFDEIIENFKKLSIEILYSSGTTGRFTFMPRDLLTFRAGAYAFTKGVVGMGYPLWDYYNLNVCFLGPHPRKTNLYVGKAGYALFDVVKNATVMIDREINTRTIRLASGRTKGLRERILSFFVGSVSKRMNRNMVSKTIKWMEEHEKSRGKCVFIGTPFVLDRVLSKLEEMRKGFNFGKHGFVITAGGWKIFENRRVPDREFRKRTEKVLGIPEENCLDIYAMVECTAAMIQCPQGHYFHIPYTHLYPLVLNEHYEPVGFGKEGRFAFLDPLARSYPGFIITGDKVKMLERCPVCDRPGPVLEPNISRISGEGDRGCNEEMRMMLSRDLGEI